MKVSLNWIKEFVDIPAKYSAKMLADLLTLRTCEVEGYEDQGRGLEGVVIGEMLKFSKHPNADKLNVAKVDIGRKEPLNLIFGQMVTMHIGDRIPIAVAPTVLPTGLKIEAKDLRGVRSEGMLCLEQELGMKETGVSLLYFPKTKPGTPLAEALGLNDVIFEIDNKSITHRPDLWGHYGMAREFAAFLGKKLKSFVARTPGRLTGSGPKAKVDIAKKEIAARFLATIVFGIKVEESPQWLKNRLLAVGMRPVNNIVDITNYVMLELGQPLHAFDRRVVENDHFVIRYAKSGEVTTTLDHKKRQLSTEDALVTNGDTVLGIAGVMGGLNSEITPKTTDIILEVATWNPIMIRKTAQRHGLRTDAAQRFEKSLDPEITGIAFHRAVELILKICPTAKLAGPVTDVYPRKYKPVSVLLNIAQVNKKIGVDISEKEMAAHLKALEFAVGKAKKGFLKITVPSFRATKDINIEDDLVEEIARMHGYEKIPPILPMLPIKLPIENRERVLKHRTRQIFSMGLGFTEVSLYSFYGAPEVRKALLPEELHMRLENPLTEDQTHLRISLLPNMLKSAAVTLYSRDNLKLYEIGRTYIKEKEYFPREEKFITGVIARSETTKQSQEIFYNALGALQAFLDQFGAKVRIDVAQTLPPYAHPSKCAAAKSAGQEIATIYEVHPQVLKNFGIESSVAAFEINFSRLVAVGQTQHAYHSLPRFPGIEIDISVLVPKLTPVREALELIRKTDQQLIANVSLIDIFEDKSLGADKKSFTFRVLLQSPDRTLTDEEMKQIQQRIFSALQGSGFVIRGG
ncbi:phenylalanine--tRNA ligase subunit beta [Candidatus Peregrinibacteria bacterium]|nr:phenylalanine--tRNA ligase subunit beta [Candidatus Peregrinibacteria bacterium]